MSYVTIKARGIVEQTMSPLTIAITAAGYPITNRNHLWCNGLNQNCLFLALLLDKMKHYVYIVHNDLEKLKTSLGFPSHLNLIHTDDLPKVHFHVVITMGHTLKVNIMKAYRERYPNTKHIMYVCGTPFIGLIENTIFREKVCALPRYEYDQIWVVPQNIKTNLDFLRVYFNTDRVTVVPFVWSPYLGEEFLRNTNGKEYEPSRPIESIAVMEPNMSVVKHCLFPILVAEDFLRQKNEFKYLFLMCADKLRKHPNLLDLLRGTELQKQKKVSAEHRYPTLSTLGRFAELVLSFQWGNPLNYLYLDVAWWGWPIVHNAEFCQDVGYYYSDFNASEAVSALQFAFQNHAQDTTYKLRMRETIRRYTSDNPQLLQNYNRLLTDTMEGTFRAYTYQWRTNSIV